MEGAAARWERAAELYARSEHRSGEDLELVLTYAAPTGVERVLDIGAGAGHTALILAPQVAKVVVTDPVPGMLETARRLFSERGLDNAEFVQVSAERLPFADRAFEIVTSRLAAHHFDDLDLALREIVRVLRPGGTFVLVDTVAPDDRETANFLNTVERLRDPTHVHCNSRAEWDKALDRAGLRVEATQLVRKSHDFEAWLTRGGASLEAMAEVRRLGLQAPPDAVRALQIEVLDGRVQSFADEKLVVRARRPGA